MVIWEKARRRWASRRVSAEDFAALERSVATLAKTVDELVVRQARVQEELTLLRHEQIATRGSAR